MLVRLCNPHSILSRNFELDGTENPYLALADILGVGLYGIVESKERIVVGSALRHSVSKGEQIWNQRTLSKA